MDTYIARQAIMDRFHNIIAYEILYQQDSSTLYNQHESKVANAVIDFFCNLDESKFLNGKDAFLTFPPSLLLRNIPKLPDEKKLVIQVEDNVLINSGAKDILDSYHNRGYRLALLDFDFNKRYLDVLPIIDIMKIDFSEPNDENIPSKLSVAHQFNMKTVAYNVNTAEAAEKSVSYEINYYQGSGVAEMVKTKAGDPAHLRSNFSRLMLAISKESSGWDALRHVISPDQTRSLLHIVNSAYFAPETPIKDIEQALSLLTADQLKQWIYLLNFSSDDGASDELIKASFQRADFCRKLSQFVPDFPIDSLESYLLGMFSTLDVLLELDLADAVAELPLSDALKDGLSGKAGVCFDLLSACIAYEKGAWSQLNHLATRLGIPLDVIAQAYFDAVSYVKDTCEKLMTPMA
ncbi:MAG: HDOD domain-containing protein [Evtepia sp.]